jgi:hypothetical protein
VRGKGQANFDALSRAFALRSLALISTLAAARNTRTQVPAVRAASFWAVSIFLNRAGARAVATVASPVPPCPQNVEQGPPDAILGLNEKFNADTSPKKVGTRTARLVTARTT